MHQWCHQWSSAFWPICLLPEYHCSVHISIAEEVEWIESQKEASLPFIRRDKLTVVAVRVAICHFKCCAYSSSADWCLQCSVMIGLINSATGPYMFSTELCMPWSGYIFSRTVPKEAILNWTHRLPHIWWHVLCVQPVFGSEGEEGISATVCSWR